MAAHPAFDTLKFVETLKESGISEKQARGFLRVLNEIIKDAKDDLVTKADLKMELFTLETRLTEKIQVVENKLTEKIQVVENRLTEKIQMVENKLTEKIQVVENRLAEKIQTLEKDMNLLKWMIGILISGVLALVLKAFF